MAQLQSKTSEKVDHSTVAVVKITPTVPGRIDLAIAEAFALIRENAERGIAIAVDFELRGTNAPRIFAGSDGNWVFSVWNARHAAEQREAKQREADRREADHRKNAPASRN